MTYTYEYREFSKRIFGKEFLHSPSGGGSSEGKKFENIYQETLNFYKEVFMMDAPQHIWETVEQRFDMKNFSFRNVNFYRLAVLYSMKAINTNFLAAPVTPTPPSGP